MTPSQQLARARNCVKLCFQEHVGDATPEFHESIFICDEFYRGRRFRSEILSAVWFAEEDELKVHSADGDCLVSLNATEMAEMVAAAAETADVLPMRVGEDVPAESQPAIETQPIRRAA